ncbi:sulfatase [Aurantiacibacter poecillastricola]|uniref:sulfatase n=1 Tax=Aurantiacibacter poecillastricola TaxID=3064385 RepID=UPI00273EB260|nr:sulfatase [Aurantiacibacter sp. 219JJ12-13]MDP5262935.1 sulfatase [Aurantiacibacter sp. 219JJ12-13]
MKPVPSLLLLFCALMLSSCVTNPESSASREDPPARNVLFIVSDDLNTRLGTYGAQVLTPNIDRLAQAGVRFDRAYSQFPWCAPSRASFMTGLRPDTVGVHDLTTPLRAKHPDLVTLPELFRQNGYFTGRVGKIFHQGVPGGVGKPGGDDPQSWDVAIDPAGHDLEVLDRLENMTPGTHIGSALAFYEDAADDLLQTDGMVASEAIRLMKEHRDEPFFIAAGFYRPHVPEVAPASYFDLYDLDRIPAWSIADQGRVPDASAAWLPDDFGMTELEQRRFIRSYYAATSFVDAQVGRLLAALEENGLSENTIVVFVSDHGFLLGEHDQWMKTVLWEPSARVPLVIYAPQMEGNGAASPRLVELIDLFPTLADLANLPSPPMLEGRSLIPLLRQPILDGWDKPVFTQVAGGRSVRTARWHYAEFEAGREGRQLFDHTVDPHETRNLADDPRYADVVAQLAALLPDQVEDRRPPLRYDPVNDCLHQPEGASITLGTPCAAYIDP